MASRTITAAAAGTWQLGDLTVNRIGLGAMRLTGSAAFDLGVPSDRERALRVLRRAVELGVDHIDSQAWELHFSEVRDCTLIVDAIFGTGLNAPVSGLIESVVADVNASGIPVVSIDLPSGLSADSCDPIGESIEAGTDRDAGGAEAAAGAAAGRNARRRHRDRRHRHPQRGRSTSLDGPRIDLLTRASMREHHHAADTGQPQGRLRPRR